MRGVKAFIDRAKDYVNEEGKIRYPCGKCLNRSLQPLEIVKSHLVRNGIQQSYKVWQFHRGSFDARQSNVEYSVDGDGDEDEMGDVLADPGGPSRFEETSHIANDGSNESSYE